MPQLTPVEPRREPAGGLLELHDVVLRFGAQAILDRVSLSVRSGEIVTLLGPNGSGKSSLVRVALGLLAPTSGRVTRRAGLSIGYVPQSVRLDGTLPLSVRRFVGLAGTASTARVQALLNDVGVGPLASASMHTVSGGELRRVLLARALLHSPDLLVLDEPTAGVDVSGQSEMYALIERLRAEHGCAVLLVSHDLHLVMAATDRVVCLNRHVCCEGAPEDVARHPGYLSLFTRDLGDNLAVYAHHHDHSHDVHGHVHDAGREPGVERNPRDG